MSSLNKLIHFQLKYCERCAGLWLRPDGAATPYCPVCEEFMAEMPRRVRSVKTNQVRKPLSAMAAIAFTILALSLLVGRVA